MAGTLSAKRASTLGVFLKVAERCNINCSYCYYFNRGNEDFQSRPAYLSADTASAFVGYVSAAVRDQGFDRVEISLHGGEPLMMKRGVFRDLCAALRRDVGSAAELDISLQTNAMLVDEAWLRDFESYGVAVAASVDGPKAINDRFRLDHRGRGTYDRTAAGIELLRQAHLAGRLPRFGILVVIDPAVSGRAVYRHLVDELGVKSFDFLYPESTVDSSDAARESGCAAYMREVHVEWRRDRGKGVAIRSLSNLMFALAGGAPSIDQSATASRSRVDITIHSDGDISLDDRIRLVSRELSSTKLNVHSSGFSQLLGARGAVAAIRDAEARIPHDCASCIWASSCRGGDLLNRYSRSRGVNNRSVYCEALGAMHEAVVSDLVEAGYSLDFMGDALSSASAVAEAMEEADAPLASRTIPIFVAANTDH